MSRLRSPSERVMALPARWRRALLSATARASECSVDAILKAVVLAASVPDPATTTGGEGAGALFGIAGAFQPPYDPEALCLPFEHSNSLRQNVEAHATNIDGFGRGAYSRALSSRDLAPAGVGFPPFHGFCRTTTVAGA